MNKIDITKLPVIRLIEIFPLTKPVDPRLIPFPVTNKVTKK